jgi:hypothetical protein
VAEINGDTVEALLEEVRDLLDAEDKRAQSLNARGSGLAAFVGLIVSLVSVVGRASVVDLSEGARTALAVLLVVAVVLLLASLGAVILGVLLPTVGQTVKLEEVQRYPTFKYVSQPRVMAQGRRMRGLIKALSTERLRNGRKATWLKSGYVLLGLGLICIGSAGLILGVERLL